MIFLSKLLCVACFCTIVPSFASTLSAREGAVIPKDRIAPTFNFTGDPRDLVKGEEGRTTETPGSSPWVEQEKMPTTLKGAITAPESKGVEKIDIVPSVGIPLVFNDAVERYITYFTTTKKGVFRRWLQKKTLYEPVVTRILKEYGLPEDLIYLAMIESGFDVRARSAMNADGLWQFIPETGKRYGLIVNHWIDERRDIEKSTIAAARYLQQLFDQFDCWYLAAAAYNAGENRIDRLIKRHDTRDFWQLRNYSSLPRETREYIPQLIAAAILSKNPEKYGFDEVKSVRPLRFVEHPVPGGVALTTVARAASTSIDTLKTLNPELLTDITPPGKECRLKLPTGTHARRFKNSLATILKKEKRVIGVIDYVIKDQDNPQILSRRYGVSEDELVMINNGPLGLKKGDLVYIPQFSAPTISTPSSVRGRTGARLASHGQKISSKKSRKYSVLTETGRPG